MGIDDDADRVQRFTELYARTHRALLGYALRRVVDPADAADIVAETFLVAWRRLDQVPPGPDARPWLFGVARRALANLHRGERRRDALTTRIAENLAEIAPPPEPDEPDVVRALGRLGPDDQEILRLVAWEELARDEIAVVLGISRGAVRVRLHRARRRLAEQMRRLALDVDDGSVARRPSATGQVTDGWTAVRPGVEEAR